MNILAIETSTSTLSVAARRKDGVSAEINLAGGLTHTENLVRLIKQALETLRLKKESLDIMACGLGPGSFTGLRIGLSAMKALALGLRKKVVGVSSLDLIAEGVSMPSGKLAVIMDAKRSQVYMALYRFREGSPQKIVKDSLVSFDQLMKGTDQNTVFTGNALVPYGEKIRKTLGRSVVFLKEAFWNPRASSVFRLIQKEKGKIRFLSLNRLKPAYLRLSEAEERRKKG